jgi:hypothetical protein
MPSTPKLQQGPPSGLGQHRLVKSESRWPAEAAAGLGGGEDLWEKGRRGGGAQTKSRKMNRTWSLCSPWTEREKYTQSHIWRSQFNGSVKIKWNKTNSFRQDLRNHSLWSSTIYGSKSQFFLQRLVCLVNIYIFFKKIRVLLVYPMSWLKNYLKL